MAGMVVIYSRSVSHKCNFVKSTAVAVMVMVADLHGANGDK